MLILPLDEEGASRLALSAVEDRIIGTLFASALGDAIGLYTEFLSEEESIQAYPSQSFTFLPSTSPTPFLRDSHRAPNDPGEWTDDTDHAMLILLGFLHGDGHHMDTTDFAHRLQIWVQMGLRALNTLPLGLGVTVGKIVRTPGYLEDPEGTSRMFWEASGYNAAPNGSVMRTHPVGLMCINKTLEETLQIAADYSVVTHVDPRCIISCSVGCALIRGLVRGEINSEHQVDRLIEGGLEWFTAYWNNERNSHPERQNEPDLDNDEYYRHARVNDLSDLLLDEPDTIGYTYKTFGSGVHLLRLAMRRTSSLYSSMGQDTIKTRSSIFEPLIVDLIMRGGDADTNACFAGALLGAYLGYGVLPPHWRDGLKYGHWLMDKAVALTKVLGVVEGSYSGMEDRDTALDGGRGYLTEQQVGQKWDDLNRKITAKRAGR